MKNPLPKLLLFCALMALTVNFTVFAQTPTETQAVTVAPEKTDAVEKESSKTESDKTAKTETKKSEPKKSDEEYPPAIADNSFYIEEAFNQEPGVMQTISTCAWFRRPSNDVACTVTQEFPFKSQKHQIGFTAPVSFLDSGRVNGAGDLTLNYRYQLFGEKDWAAVSPRVSLILPTGSTSRGLGLGSTGLQFNLPVSKRVSKDFVTHFNAGMTFLSKVKGEDVLGNSVKRNLTAYNVGGSAIWLAHPRFNVMFEYLENFSSEINEFGRVNRFNEHIVNPGVRFAFDFGPLQIVPGISVPTSISRGETRTGVFFYLSFEHPFKRIRQISSNPKSKED